MKVKIDREREGKKLQEIRKIRVFNEQDEQIAIITFFNEIELITIHPNGIKEVSVITDRTKTKEKKFGETNWIEFHPKEE